MNKLMRKSPLIIAAVFLLVQISGLAAYANQAGGMDEVRALLFALALEAGIFGAAYFVRTQTTRGASIAVLVLFLVVSGFLNTAKSWRDLPADADELAQISAVVFGLVPSLFAALLGGLQAYVAKLPPLAHKSEQDTPVMLAYAITMQWLTLVKARLSAPGAPDAKAGKHKCARCGAWVDNPGSHARWSCPKRNR